MEINLRVAEDKDLKWLSDMRIKLAKLEAKRACIKIENYSYIGLDESGTSRILSSCEVVESNDKKIGYFRSVNEDLCEIYIDPKYRRKGVGADIIKKLSKRLKRICVVVRKNNQHGIKFYKDNGFDYVEDWGAVLFMKKECGMAFVTYFSNDRALVPARHITNALTARLERVGISSGDTDGYKICEIYNSNERLVGKIVVYGKEKEVERYVKDAFSRKLKINLDIKNMGFLINGEQYRLRTLNTSKFCIDWLDKDYFVFNSPEKIYITSGGTKLAKSKIECFYCGYDIAEDEDGNILVSKNVNGKIVKLVDILRLDK